MTEARTIPPILDGCVQALGIGLRTIEEDVRVHEMTDDEKQFLVHCVVKYLRLRHAIDLVALEQIKDEEAK